MISGLVEQLISFLFGQRCEGLHVDLDQFGELIAKGNYSLLDFKEAVTITQPTETDQFS